MNAVYLYTLIIYCYNYILLNSSFFHMSIHVSDNFDFWE